MRNIILIIILFVSFYGCKEDDTTNSPTIEKWSVLSSGTTNKLNSVFFTDVNTGYIAGNYYGAIFKTINGGDTWTAYSDKRI